MTELTEKQIHILKHTVGLDRSTEMYRNRFIAGSGHDERPILSELVEAGLMGIAENRGMFGDSDCFYVTEKGMQWIKDNCKPQL